MNPDLILHIFALFIFCLILAALEVQIEGKAGWASKLPTWKPASFRWYSRLYRRVMSEKDMTGYHLLVFSLVFFFLHYPYFVGKTWNLPSELTTIALFFLVTIIWDFLWFVLNPNYGLSHFRSKNIWWHKKWFLFMPVDYYFGFIVSVLFYVRFSFNWLLLKEWFAVVGLFLVLTLAVVIFAVITDRFRLRHHP